MLFNQTLPLQTIVLPCLTLYSIKHHVNDFIVVVSTVIFRTRGPLYLINIFHIQEVLERECWTRNKHDFITSCRVVSTLCKKVAWPRWESNLQPLTLVCLWTKWLGLRLQLIALRIDVKEHIGGIIVTERCCFAQLLKVVHSVSEKWFFAPLGKAIRYSVNVALIASQRVRFPPYFQLAKCGVTSAKNTNKYKYIYNDQF